MSKVSSRSESKQIVTGIKWTSIQMVVDTLFRFLVRLLLAKLLLPEDFGLVGMATVFIGVAGAASELGMGTALIQRKNDEEAKAMYPTAFWSGIGWGIIVYLLISLLIAPIAANFYDEPLLIKLIPTLSLGILLKPLSMIHTVILTRSMNFKRLSQVLNAAAITAGIVALITAYFNFGVWALAINNVLAVGLTIPLLFMITKWRPVWAWNKLHFNKIFGFGAYSTGTNIFSTLTYNIDNLMIGKMLGASFLGSYTLAFSLTEHLRQVISRVLNKVMYPVFSKAQDDKDKLRNYFLKVVNINALLIYPLMAYLLIFAEDIVMGFFGEKWKLTIVPLQILSIAMMVHLLVNSFTALLRGVGKPRLEMKIIMSLTVFVLFPSLFFGITFFGLSGAASAILLNKIGLAIAGLIALKREIELPFIGVLKAVKSALIGIFLASAIISLMRIITNINDILILTPIYGILYLGIVYCFEGSNLSRLSKTLR